MIFLRGKVSCSDLLLLVENRSGVRLGIFSSRALYTKPVNGSMLSTECEKPFFELLNLCNKDLSPVLNFSCLFDPVFCINS